MDYMLEKIQDCFRREKILFSRHARVEMEAEEFGVINEREVSEAVLHGRVIEDYPNPACR